MPGFDTYARIRHLCQDSIPMPGFDTYARKVQKVQIVVLISGTLGAINSIHPI